MHVYQILASDKEREVAIKFAYFLKRYTNDGEIKLKLTDTLFSFSFTLPAFSPPLLHTHSLNGTSQQQHARICDFSHIITAKK
jgi:hypothetical protein